jgi:hypothetical protein
MSWFAATRLRVIELWVGLPINGKTSKNEVEVSLGKT